MENLEGTKLVVLGAMLVAGFLAHLGGPLIHVPRVTLLLLIGVLVGPAVFGVVPAEITDWFPFVAHLALAIIGFLLGEEFHWGDIRKRGRRVLGISIGETIAAAVVVFLAVLALSGDLVLALILAGIAPASAPAAIFETVREGRAKGELTDTLLGVVAIDDAWGVIAFSVLLVIASALGGEGAALQHLPLGLWEVFGAILLGIAMGLPMAWLSRNIRGGQLTLLEASGIVFLQTGIATMIGVSYLLAAIVLGAVVVNLSKREQTFKEIEHVREPLLAVFFILAGLKLDLTGLADIALIGALYVAARVIGLYLGGRVSGRMLEAPPDVRRRIGWCIMPQAGVALGFALLVQDELPEYGDRVLPLVIASTVLFELAGPLMARIQLRLAGEWRGDTEGTAT
ncbi:MAG: cation:proton antiporter [Planctomycetota bacterium]|nr:cation:proton antiporter [Planctomycetota bacterium]